MKLANQRVLARRRSLPIKGCRCEEAETTNLKELGCTGTRGGGDALRLWFSIRFLRFFFRFPGD